MLRTEYDTLEAVVVFERLTEFEMHFLLEAVVIPHKCL